MLISHLSFVICSLDKGLTLVKVHKGQMTILL